MNARAKLLSILLAEALLVGGCGDSKSGGSSPSTSGQPPAVTGAAGQKPQIAKPKGDPPSTLVIKDLKKGTGKTAVDGDKVNVQYVGVSWSTGEEFDASWDRGQSFPFQLGTGQVIPGWDKGVKGMKVGGRRELAIPPGLAYGAQGSPPAIAPNETLVFVIDLDKVKR